MFSEPVEFFFGTSSAAARVRRLSAELLVYASQTVGPVRSRQIADPSPQVRSSGQTTDGNDP